jgi:hypothetical protein
MGGIPQNAGLPAMAVGQVVKMLLVLALSLAGLAPTGIFGVAGGGGISQKLWEPALVAMAVGQ